MLRSESTNRKNKIVKSKTLRPPKRFSWNQEMAEVLKHHKARKRFGQNFLNDDFWINKIAEAVDPKEGQKIIEIGPGQAALTKELIAGAKHIYCVEIDRDLAAWLRTKFTSEQLTVLEADALKFDWRDFAAEEKIRVVGNLPYNISSPLLFKLSEISDRVVDQHFMLQKEVVDRMVAAPGTKAYGRLSVMLQRKYRMIKLFDVSPEAFTPAPKVMSSVVRMVPIQNPAEVDEETFYQVVAASFAMRRKTLKNNLSKWISAEMMEEAGIKPEQRAESVPLENFIRLARLVHAAGISIVLPGQV